MRLKRGVEREDYIKTIYELDDEKGKGVKSVKIAKRLNIKKASVSEMLKKLACEGLVKAEKYSNVFLTEEGKKFAEGLFDRHKIIKEFLMKKLNCNEYQAYDEAHRLEHAFSEESIAKLKELVEGRKESPMPRYVG